MGTKFTITDENVTIKGEGASSVTIPIRDLVNFVLTNPTAFEIFKNTPTTSGNVDLSSIDSSMKGDIFRGEE